MILDALIPSPPTQFNQRQYLILLPTIHLLLISVPSVYSRLMQDQLVSEFNREDGVVWWAGVTITTQGGG